MNPSICFSNEGSQGQSATDEFRNPFIPQFPEKKKEVVPAKETSDAEIDQEPTDIEIVTPYFSITGLVWNSHRPQAIINNQIVDVGDTVDDSTITDIQKKGVTIEYQGKEFFIDAYTSESTQLEKTK